MRRKRRAARREMPRMRKSRRAPRTISFALGRVIADTPRVQHPSPMPAPAPLSAFAELGLDAALLRAVAEAGYETPSPIQARCIPPLLAGRDLLGLAQTGTGKTAAFALPILQRLVRNPRQAQPRHCRALILTPTRELAAQILESFRNYGRHTKITSAVIFGGVGFQHQIDALKRGVDVLVATPGRLLDLKDRGALRLDGIEVFVLDEADRMLDMGFAPAVRKVVEVIPRKRHTLLFSATMPETITRLADSLLTDPEKVAVAPISSTAEKVEQHLCLVNQPDQKHLLLHILQEHPEGLVIIFMKMKHQCNKLADFLIANGHPANAIHGNKSQGARERALADFKSGKARILVATDIAARGIDVKGVELVVNYELPDEPEAYVHRIGRTARAGASGKAIAFCAPDERSNLRDIERTIKQTIPVVPEHPFKVGGKDANRQPTGEAKHPYEQPHKSGTPKAAFNFRQRRNRGR